MSNKKYFIPLCFGLCIALGILIGNSITKGNAAFFESSNVQKAIKMVDVIDLLDKNYVDSINGDKILEEAITEMLHKLDPHTTYIPAAELAQMSEMLVGQFGGVGIKFSNIEDTICVVNVLKDSPSQRAGVMAGDKIIQIDGKRVAGQKMGNDGIMKLLKGQENTKVKVELLRKGKLLNKVITRAQIPIESVVAAAIIKPGIGYIKLDHFSVTSADEFRLAAQKLKMSGMTKLIFDLRDNGGGDLQSAINISNEFLHAGQVIVSTKGKKAPVQKYNANGSGMLQDLETVVLVNTNSASASEVVSGALQDNDRATIIGRRTFGKGLVQTDKNLKDGSSIRMTIARYYTPTGRCIQKPYDSDFEAYSNEKQERVTSGELFHADTLQFKNAPKFKTKKGKTVYGGGGIFPDKFIPLDSNQYSIEAIDLMYSGAYQKFVFSYLEGKREQFKNKKDFLDHFVVSDQLYLQLLEFHNKNKNSAYRYTHAKTQITNFLKAEMGRQLFGDEVYFLMLIKQDNEVNYSLDFLK